MARTTERSGRRPRALMLLALSLVAGLWFLTGSSAAQTGPADFAETRRAAAALPRLHGLVVSRRGETVFEYYAKGYSANRAVNVKSASKSVISALVGIAIDQGKIKGVAEPASAFFPELLKDADRRKQAITVEHLLTMRSGLRSTSGQNYGQWVQSRNWVTHALTRPMVSEPGTTMQYSTGSSHLLSAILTKASGTSTWQFAQTALGKPLGIQFARWPQDPQGIYFGGNDMLLTPPQMIAFGELYLNKGRVNGRQIVPAEWVETSCVPRTTSRFDPGREYGYGWWIDDVGNYQACYAWGFGGQFIFVFADLDLVIAAASSTAVSDERRGYRRDLLALIDRHILEVID